MKKRLQITAGWLLALAVSGLASARAQDAAEAALRALAKDYYAAVAQEDLETVMALMTFDGEKAKRDTLCQYQAAFAVMDMAFPAVEVSAVEIAPDGASGAVCVGVQSRVTFADGSSRAPEGPGRFVLLARRQPEGWRLVKVMRAATCVMMRNAVIQRRLATAIEREAAEGAAAAPAAPAAQP
jgi:ketosteroid isomerase-like protein